MENRNISKIENLLEKGVKIPNPQSVEIGDDVDIERISGKNVVIYSGCKIYGKSTLILQGAKLGYEGPVTVEDCYIGPDVELKNGFFRKAVFLKKANMGAGAHVREGTILEEESGGSHTVGLKQTILFPFVTLGSLINFCDCLMCGGTSRKNHSEVGSSFIHFNYTPNQDKATPSLVGDVPKGVMLNQKPIFLGGQGGLVGPCRLTFGTITAAGTICRNDELREGRLIFEGGRSGNIPYSPGFVNVKRIIANNLIYIANLTALMQWYINVRSEFISDDFPQALSDGLKETLNMAVDERIKRLKEFCIQNQKELCMKWDEADNFLKSQQNHHGNTVLRDSFLEAINSAIKKSGKDYLTVIKNLSSQDAANGTRWLQGIADNVTDRLTTSGD